VDSPDDVSLLLSKLQYYEFLDASSSPFAREMLVLGGIYPYRLEDLVDELVRCGAVGENLNPPEELYPDNGLNRETALAAFDEGYQIVVHSDHCGTSKIGCPRDYEGGPQQFIHDFDFGDLQNQGEPSIFWTLGCWPGHFEGADCFAEASLLTDELTGFVAAVANARSGSYSDWVTYYSFIDALYPFGWADNPPPGPQYRGPVSNLGEAYRYSMTRYRRGVYERSNSRLSFQNLFGDPTMFVWRDNPATTIVTPLQQTVPIGMSDISVLVEYLDMGIPTPLAYAKVCIWMEGDVFSIGFTDQNGVV
jgi:hypothetical protein